ncbi:MAG TPA: hypothetical protein VMN60_08415, partial [Longimicrobiales bacterium]|nr:hypothetical protein [Longimicrobiales bacterium]
MIRVCLMLALCAWVTPASAAAQRPRPGAPPPPADTLSPEQRALERLRALQRVGEPDSVRTAADSIRPQQVEVRGAGEATPPPSPIERDSIMDLLLRISGYVGTEYRGDTANFVA